MATRNRYAEIMAQYAQSQPFSFTGYPSTYTGGYDIAQPQAYAAPVNRYGEIMGQGSMGGGRMTQADEGSTWSEPTSQQAYNVSQLGKNLRYVSPIAGLLTSAYGNYLASQVNPNYSNEGKNYPAPNGGFVAVTPQQAAAAEAARQPITETIRSDQSLSGGNTGGGGGRYSGDNSGLNAGWGSRDAGGLAQGGYVSMQHLQGPDPEGPDDGYAALKDGEYVINDQAVNQYGIELMNLINSGKISKGELLGLLEM